jgi:hypothetical protein
MGRNFLDTIELNMKCGEAVIKPLINENAFSEICQISVNSDYKIDVDLSHIQDNAHKQAIQRFVNKYKLERIQEVDFGMKFILKDDEPIYQKARRLSASEKTEVNAQMVEKWNCTAIGLGIC